MASCGTVFRGDERVQCVFDLTEHGAQAAEEILALV
jgi:hypothetical protein